jgi:hypothetical protein
MIMERHLSTGAATMVALMAACRTASSEGDVLFDPEKDAYFAAEHAAPRDKVGDWLLSLARRRRPGLTHALEGFEDQFPSSSASRARVSNSSISSSWRPAPAHPRRHARACATVALRLVTPQRLPWNILPYGKEDSGL